MLFSVYYTNALILLTNYPKYICKNFTLALFIVWYVWYVYFLFSCICCLSVSLSGMDHNKGTVRTERATKTRKTESIPQLSIIQPEMLAKTNLPKTCRKGHICKIFKLCISNTNLHGSQKRVVGGLNLIRCWLGQGHHGCEAGRSQHARTKVGKTQTAKVIGNEHDNRAWGATWWRLNRTWHYLCWNHQDCQLMQWGQCPRMRSGETGVKWGSISA